MRTLEKLALLLGLAFMTPACTTDGFCFDKCGGGGSGNVQTDGGGAVGGQGGQAHFQTDAGTGGSTCTGFGCNQPDSGQGGCTPTNGGKEICDNVDNNCNGQIDEPGDGTTGVNYSDPRTCGNCSNDCVAVLTRVVTPICHPPTDLGKAAGTCDYDTCAPSYYDIDGNRANGCEYYCPWNPNGTNTKDLGGVDGCGRDDNCNGQVDEDVNTCTDTENCGLCGFKCVVPHATPACVPDNPGGPCDRTNTHCKIQACDAGYYDADGSPDNGCEYSCTPTNNGVEICDGVDNDCDGRIDNADPDLKTSDPTIGQNCFGGDKGLCSDPSHQGVTKCIGVSVQCCDVDSNNIPATNPNFEQTGLENGICKGNQPPFVLHPGDQLEVCNNLDDDCNGVVDDQTTDSGALCGSSTGTCHTGLTACVSGALACVGGTAATAELCDGLDNDCDGVIDGTKPSGTPTPCTQDSDCTVAPNTACLPLSSDPNNKGCVTPPTDITANNGACDIPPPPPAGVPQPCKAGVSACFGGVPVCVGSIKPQLGTDLCGQDTNCNGVLENQTGLANSDPKNCGACGNDCSALGPNALWDCVAGVCKRSGCQPGFIECGGANANDCETQCTFQSSTESCNGVDDNCNCQVDEGTITPPSPAQACGVNAAATDPGCSSKVSLSCTSGTWKCTFTDPAYCTAGSCPATPDVCDGKDNNCDGQVDESFKPPALLVGFLGQACFSDDGKPAPGDGPCRTQGSFVCRADGTGTQCSAVKDLSKATTETCDGIDNNCDGIVDNNLSSDARIGKQCFGGTKGICALASHAGTTSCQTGAVVCSGANIVHPGDKVEVCNGLDDDCDGIVDNNLTDTGALCGSSVGQCKSGTQQCVSGKLTCVGGVLPQPEICDGLDNNCNGQIDDSPTDVGTACNVPPPPPTGVPQPCKAGVNICIGGTRVCQGSITAVQATDNCNEDTNCDGKLTNQTGLSNTDPLNCGSCGNNCNTKDVNSTWACQAGVCVHTGCASGHIDCDANASTCETACTPTSATESCNNKDDDCNCKVDDNVPPATPVQVCGVSPSATDVGCTTGVATTCTAGAWKCTFPTGYCTGGNCSATVDSCDNKDNNCNGVTDENFKPPLLLSGYEGQACTSDQGKTPGDGPCQTTGTYVCNAAGTATQCSAVKDASKATAEMCNGIDDNCDGIVDNNLSADTRIGKQCFGGTQGACAAVAHAGTTACVSGAVQCQGANLLSPGQQPEVCNGIDDDCNGIVDDNPTDVGGTCGSGVGACQLGKYACVSGAKVCQGSVGPQAEICDGIDNDCDGVVDGTKPATTPVTCAADADCAAQGAYNVCLPISSGGKICAKPTSDTGGDCQVPPAAPPPTAQCTTVTEPCKKGALACIAGVLQCKGSVTASASTPDGCCVDSNCDGLLTNQPNLQTDVKNCGACGNDCTAKGGHVNWACTAGVCTPNGCANGFIDCDGNKNDCEKACSFSGTELCNGVDDDCNCKIDDNIASIPTPSQVCGVSPAAQAVDSKCGPGDGTTGVKVACTSGAWACTFPSGYCNQGTPTPSCATTPDNCDSKDNNCNGVLDDNYNKPILQTGYIGQPCASDDGKLPPGDGACRTTGTYVCNGTTATKCNAVRDNTKAGPELCDSIDNDCDGSVDEPFSAKGTNTTYFVKPSVVKLATNLWIYQYEASRPNATASSPGSGDGYWCTSCSNNVPNAPSGVTLDKTPACSVSGTIPWFNVTPTEVEETCQAMGGFVCSTANWTTACQSPSGTCQWGYGSNCSTSPATLTAGDGTVYYDTSKSPYCNLGLYDFDQTAGAPNADGLLPSMSGSLQGCFANWAGAGNIFDITGNLKEITKRGANDYPVMGGAFSTQSDDGAACTFTFASVPSTFKFFDTGFRCCFSSDPTQ